MEHMLYCIYCYIVSNVCTYRSSFFSGFHPFRYPTFFPNHLNLNHLNLSPACCGCPPLLLLLSKNMKILLTGHIKGRQFGHSWTSAPCIMLERL